MLNMPGKEWITSTQEHCHKPNILANEVEGKPSSKTWALMLTAEYEAKWGPHELKEQTEEMLGQVAILIIILSASFKPDMTSILFELLNLYLRKELPN
jgi:hypothetical protein